MQNIRGLHKDWLKGKRRNEYYLYYLLIVVLLLVVLLSERAHKEVLTVKKNMHLILHSRCARQHRCNKSTHRNAHFYCARWRIPPRDYVHANETCPHSS